MRDVETFPWLVYPPAVDLANTVYTTPASSGDLLDSEERFALWVAAERGRIAHLDAAARSRSHLRGLRDAVRPVLHAAASGGALPPGPVSRLNAFSAAAATYPVLDRGCLRVESVATDELVLFLAAVASSAIEFAGTTKREQIAVCGAPSCGMLFVRSDARQTWCCRSCGNRARVARHARRGRVTTRPAPPAGAG